MLETLILFAMSCCLLSIYSKPVHLVICFTLGRSRAGGAGAAASVPRCVLLRTGSFCYLFFHFLKRQQTVIETKLQQLVKHLRTSTRFYPALIFRLQLLQINGGPRWCLSNPHENSCPRGSSYLSRPDIVCKSAVRGNNINMLCMSFTSSNNTKTQEVS